MGREVYRLPQTFCWGQSMKSMKFQVLWNLGFLNLWKYSESHLSSLSSLSAKCIRSLNSLWQDRIMCVHAFIESVRSTGFTRKVSMKISYKGFEKHGQRTEYRAWTKPHTLPAASHVRTFKTQHWHDLTIFDAFSFTSHFAVHLQLQVAKHRFHQVVTGLDWVHPMQQIGRRSESAEGFGACAAQRVDCGRLNTLRLQCWGFKVFRHLHPPTATIFDTDMILLIWYYWTLHWFTCIPLSA